MDSNIQRRTEPPFDGQPCPMCPSAIRNLSAVCHNTAWRVESGSYDSLCQLIPKADDLRRAVEETKPLLDSMPPELQALHAAATAFVQTWDNFMQDESWWNAVKMSAGAMKYASQAVQPLSDAHFANRAHSHGH